MHIQEVYDRYSRSKKTAESKQWAVMFDAGSIEDLHEALEIRFLWRLAIEGHPFTPMTFANMVARTNQDDK